MTAVALLTTMPVARSGEADTGGRASGESGSLFGDALTAAGQVLDGASDSGSATLGTARDGGPAAEASAVPDRTIDPQAAIAAMTHLVAWSAAATPTPSGTIPQATTPHATTSETMLPGERTPDTTVEMVPGAAGVEATPVDPASGVVETDAADTVPSDAVASDILPSRTVPSDTVPSDTALSDTASSDTVPPDAGRVLPTNPGSETASASVSASAAASASASGSAVSDGRGELRTLQGRQLGDVGVATAATPRDPADGGADPTPSDSAAAALRPEPLPRQSPPASPSVVGAPAPAVGVSPEQQLMASDAGDQAQGPQPVPATTSIAPVASPVVTPTPVSSPDPAAANRAVAAQVAPVVVSIAQRPMGTHQLTMTVNPDSLGPVTVRAHISASGEVQVELSGATDAGRDTLRTMLVELRRDLAAVMPHATLSVNHGTSADASGDRGQQAAGDAPTGQGAGDRDANRGRADHRRGVEQTPDLPRIIQTTPSATSGAGLDIFA